MLVLAQNLKYDKNHMIELFNNNLMLNFKMELERCPSQGFLGRCIIKPLLIVCIASFILYVPLGDPKDRCGSSAVVKPRNANTVICQLYAVSMKFYRKTLECLEFSVTMILDVLYELKLKIYTFLGKVDSKDLCRTVCCYDDCDKEENSPKKETKHRVCSCIKSRCSRRKSRQSVL